MPKKQTAPASFSGRKPIKTVTLDLDDSETIVLTSSSGKLIYYSSLALTMSGSSTLDTITANLNNTEWTYEYTEDGTAYKDEIAFGGEDGKTFTVTYYTNDEEGLSYSGKYSVSDDGTTVTVDYGDRQTTFIYSDGKLVYVWVFTYNGTI